MELVRALGVSPGTTAVIGSGGKTALIRRLSEELRAEKKSIIIATTTRIYPPDGCPVIEGSDAGELRAAVEKYGVVCAGARAEMGKLREPELGAGALQGLAEYVLIEADGAKGLPLKAHAEYEPVIPECAALTVQVAGADGIGRRIAEAAHRPGLYAKALGADEGHIVTAPDAARLLRGDLPTVINKARSNMAGAEALARLLEYAVVTELFEERPVISVWRRGVCLYS